MGEGSIIVTGMGIGKKTNQDQSRSIRECREGSRTERRVEWAVVGDPERLDISIPVRRWVLFQTQSKEHSCLESNLHSPSQW